MLEEYKKFVMPDKSGKGNDLIFEVNYNSKDGKTNKCQVLRFKYGEKEGYITRDHLLGMLWVIGEPAEQRKMIPQTITKVRHYETVIGIKATKNIAKGESINVAVKFPLPSVEEEVIGEIKKSANRKTNSGIILPS